MIGSKLEELGWRQGSLLDDDFAKKLSAKLKIPFDDETCIIVSSQSCDIANDKIELDPVIELSIARIITQHNGNLTHNKNPRVLHTSILKRTGNADISDEIKLELKAYQKYQIPKEELQFVGPDQDRFFEESLLKSYVEWLAARYSRPALPTVFNNRVSIADKKGKLKDKAKKASGSLTGLYVSISPDAEVDEDESYSVELLGLLPANFNGDLKSAQNAIDTYEKILLEAGMDVKAALQTEDKISIAVMRRFKRFYLDDLSFKGESTLPIEVDNIV